MDLTDYRLQLDELDGELLRLFLRRLEISESIGAYKREHALPILDQVREREKLERCLVSCPERYREEALELMRTLMALSRQVQAEGGKGKC